MSENQTRERPTQKDRAAEVLTAGLPGGMASWLERRLDGLAVWSVDDAPTALAALDERTWDLLIVHYRVVVTTEPNLLEQIRRRCPSTDLPVFCVLDGLTVGDSPYNLVHRDGVDQILFEPLDWEGVARHAAERLGLILSPLPTALSEEQRTAASAITALWQRFKAANLGRLDVLEDATVAARDGTLDADIRQQARRAAHKLAGAAGTFGFSRGSRIALEMEQSFENADALDQSAARRLTDLVRALRAELERPPIGPMASPATWRGKPFLLVIDDDGDVGSKLIQADQAETVRLEVVSTFDGIRDVVASGRPDAILFDRPATGLIQNAPIQIAELNALYPGVPIVVLAERDEFVDRLEGRIDSARDLGIGFLRKSTPPAEIIATVAQSVSLPRFPDTTVLAVDDDPQILAAVRHLLEPHGLDVVTADDPLRFGDVLCEASPDLVMLDVDMPHLSGIELCRSVRNDPRWNGLPILFLTARTDGETVYRVFAAGADDYVTKPIVGPELLTRITNRLERVRLYRIMAETDFLTGVANPRKATQVLDRLLHLASRHGQPVSIAVLDLDHFKKVNDQHGHAAGDAVLRRLGDLLLRGFRTEDLVSRWGGEEFVLGLYGMTRAAGVERVTAALRALRRERFVDLNGIEFQVTFSAGIAQFPDDGSDFPSLYRAADEALYVAKASGRDQAIPVGWTPSPLS